MGESVLFSFLCKLIAGLIDFSWQGPPHPLGRASQMEGAVQKELSTQDLNGRPGQEVGARRGHRRTTAGSDQA